MNQYGGDLTPSVTPTITPVVNTTEKSKETIPFTPAPPEYFDMFSHDVSVVQHFIQNHGTKDQEIYAEFIAKLNREINDAIQSHLPGYDFIDIIHKLPMEKTNMVANYLNLLYDDEDIKRLTKKTSRKMKEDIKLFNWVFTLYCVHTRIKKLHLKYDLI